jgi:Regulator of chromosome condensation (RCC1) repeat
MFKQLRRAYRIKPVLAACTVVASVAACSFGINLDPYFVGNGAPDAAVPTDAAVTDMGDATVDARLPDAPPPSVGLTSIAVGYSHSCGIKSDGTAVCWGDGSYGRLGNGSSKTSSVPVAVSKLFDLRQIAVGGYHSRASRKLAEASSLLASILKLAPKMKPSASPSGARTHASTLSPLVPTKRSWCQARLQPACADTP